MGWGGVALDGLVSVWLVANTVRRHTRGGEAESSGDCPPAAGPPLRLMRALDKGLKRLVGTYVRKL